MKYRIVHRTEYEYGSEVVESFSEARLLPRDLPTQQCHERRLRILPTPSDYRERDDFYGNRVASFTHRNPHRKLSVEATSVVETRPSAPDLLAGAPWEDVVERLHSEPMLDCISARQFALDSPLVALGDDLREYGERSFWPGRPFVEAVREISARIRSDFTYKPGSTTLRTPAAEALEGRTGVCQDFSHVMIGSIRSMGLAARYVSGYLETRPPAGTERLIGADASHAWVSVFMPGSGWFDLDPTNDLVVGERHITTAWGRDYTDVTPLKGVLFSDGGTHELTVSVDVEPVLA